MEKEHFIRLLEHEKWATKAILDCVLTAEEVPKRVEAIFSHLLNAQQVWYDRAVGRNSGVAVWQNIPRIDWGQQIDDHQKMWIQLVKDTDDFGRRIEYKNSKGVAFTSTLADILTHLSLHSQYHRGQIIVLIKPYVEKLPATDFIFWARD